MSLVSHKNNAQNAVRLLTYGQNDYNDNLHYYQLFILFLICSHNLAVNKVNTDIQQTFVIHSYNIYFTCSALWSRWKPDHKLLSFCIYHYPILYISNSNYNRVFTLYYIEIKCLKWMTCEMPAKYYPLYTYITVYVP